MDLNALKNSAHRKKKRLEKYIKHEFLIILQINNLD